MPESLQYTEKAQTLKDNAETLYDLEKVIDGVVEEIEKLISNEPED